MLIPTNTLASVPPADAGVDLISLFRQSFDPFTIVLIAGSIAAVAIIVRCAIDIRAARINPREEVERFDNLLRSGHVGELDEILSREQTTFTGAVLRAGWQQRDRGPGAIREAAELEAGEQTARWMRRVDLLSVIGNLGPLVGLAGTVWGMIIAFVTLNDTAGRAGPAALSLGISKALFHTLLGLLLAIPCLLAYGIFRNAVDRVCSRALVDASRLIERIPVPRTRA